MPRSWIPEDSRLSHTVFPLDGGIEAFGAIGYARSFSESVSGLYSSHIMTAKTKVSSLDVGDNKLLSSLMASRLAEVVHASLPEAVPGVKCVLITDSKCTSFAHSEGFNHTERRRRNIGVRFQRSIRRLHNENNELPIILCWGRSHTNPADLVSKMHPDVDQILNSNFYRHGSPMYTADDFPANFSVYAYLANQQFTFVGFPNQDQHQANCNFCQTVSLSTGLEGAQRLVATAQLNAGSPAVSRPDTTFEGQLDQLCPTHPAGHASDSSWYEIFAAGQPETPLCTHGFYSEASGPLGAGTSLAMHTVDRSGQPKTESGIRY